jgi:hypothetical protein
VTLDGNGPGLTFDGLGGLIAGAGTRLLFDYPEVSRYWPVLGQVRGDARLR